MVRSSLSGWLAVLSLGIGCSSSDNECGPTIDLALSQDPEFMVSWAPACQVDEIDIRSASQGRLVWRVTDVRPPVQFSSGTAYGELESGATYDVTVLVERGRDLLVLAETTFVQP